MRLTRHARNRIRWVRRTVPDLTPMDVVAAIPLGRELEPDPDGRRRVTIDVAGIRLTAVTTADGEVLITVWRD